MNGAGRLRRHVTRHAARKRELLEQPLHPVGVERDARVVFGIAALEVRVGGVAVTETWSGAVQAIRDIEASVRAGSSSHQLSYRVPARSPTLVTVDRITLYPLTPGTCGAAPST